LQQKKKFSKIFSNRTFSSGTSVFEQAQMLGNDCAIDKLQVFIADTPAQDDRTIIGQAGHQKTCFI